MGRLTTLRSLPGWVQLVFGVGAVIIIALTASTVTLVSTVRSSDKHELSQSIDHVRDVVETLVAKQEVMNRENADRNHTIRYLVMLMCVPYKDRQNMMGKYHEFFNLPKDKK